MEYLNDNKFEALKLRFMDQAALLVKMTEIDLKIFSGYITLQLALGAWLVTKKDMLPLDDFQRTVSICGLFVLDVVLAGIAGKLLYNNYMRRSEVVSTIRNLNDALGFTREGVFIKTAINAPTQFRPWWYWYLIGIIAGVVGIALIMYGIA